MRAIPPVGSFPWMKSGGYLTTPYSNMIVGTELVTVVYTWVQWAHRLVPNWEDWGRKYGNNGVSMEDCDASGDRTSTC